NEDGAAVALGVVLYIHGVELRRHLCGGARIETGIENGLRRFGDHAGDIQEECGENGRDAGHDAEPRWSVTFEKFRQCTPLRSERASKERALVGKHCRVLVKVGLTLT